MIVKSKKTNGFFLSKLSYYIRYTLPVLVVVVLAILILFSFIYHGTEDRIYDMYETSLSHGVEQLSKELQTMSTMLMTMNNTTTGRFIFSPAPINPSSIFSLNNFYYYIQNLSAANRLYADILIYFPRSDVIVSHFGCYTSLAQYLSMNVFSSEALPDCLRSPDSLSGFFTLPGCSIKVFSNKTINTAYIISTPFAVGSSIPSDNIYAYLMIDEAQLLSMFNLAVNSNASLRVLDKNGALLYQYRADREFRSGKFFEISDPIFGFSMQLEVDTSGLLFTSLKPVIIYIIFAFLICVVISVYCARRAALPMEQIASHLLEFGLSQSPDTVNFIHETIETLDRKYQEVQSTLENLQNQQRDTIIDRCLFSEKSEPIPGLPDSYAVFYCVLTNVPSDNENYLHILISQHFTQGLLSTAIPHILDGNSFILILPVASLKDSLIDKLSSLVDSVNHTLDTDIEYGISDIHSGSSTLSTAYQDAKLEYNRKHNSRAAEREYHPQIGRSTQDDLPDPNEEEREKQFVTFIRDRLSDENLNIQTIMDSLRLNEKSVYELCHDATGKTPAAYIQQIRMEHACSLLRNTDKKISDICSECGYITLNTFLKAFKRTYNVTPSQYRLNFNSHKEE